MFVRPRACARALPAATRLLAMSTPRTSAPSCASGTRGRPVAAAEVEHLAARRDAELRHERLAALAHVRREAGEVALLPECLVRVHCRGRLVRRRHGPPPRRIGSGCVATLSASGQPVHGTCSMVGTQWANRSNDASSSGPFGKERSAPTTASRTFSAEGKRRPRGQSLLGELCTGRELPGRQPHAPPPRGTPCRSRRRRRENQHRRANRVARVLAAARSRSYPSITIRPHRWNRGWPMRSTEHARRKVSEVTCTDAGRRSGITPEPSNPC